MHEIWSRASPGQNPYFQTRRRIRRDTVRVTRFWAILRIALRSGPRSGAPGGDRAGMWSSPRPPVQRNAPAPAPGRQARRPLTPAPCGHCGRARRRPRRRASPCLDRWRQRRRPWLLRPHRTSTSAASRSCLRCGGGVANVEWSSAGKRSTCCVRRTRGTSSGRARADRAIKPRNFHVPRVAALETRGRRRVVAESVVDVYSAKAMSCKL
jgi:hypothetical protein